MSCIIEFFVTCFVFYSDYSDTDAFKIRLRSTESMQVHIGIYQSRCEFFNEVSEKWDNEGCVPQEESIATVIKCACNHLTSFGGSLFVSPDELSFNDLTVSIVWLVFYLMLFIIRKIKGALVTEAFLLQRIFKICTLTDLVLCLPSNINNILTDR